MEITSTSILETFQNDDSEAIGRILSEFGIDKDGVPPEITFANRQLASAVLSLAAAREFAEGLGPYIVEEIIERTSMMVNVFQFSDLVLASMGAISNGDSATPLEDFQFDIVPEEIRTALKKNEYTERISHAIEELNDDTFNAMLKYIMSGDVKKLNRSFSLPIIWRICTTRSIPIPLVFTYMAVSLSYKFLS